MSKIYTPDRDDEHHRLFQKEVLFLSVVMSRNTQLRIHISVV